ncbi:hypothetical protein EAI_10597 [Harpegnathos saltator]|uniref:Uncharacterized protein n=1 Tax=Harpegnathos saltator TaxID=610380 RepID=E2BMP1_HARSA|nr:hypothetical protein EAI_10597 [Harpegnathos saltator]
MVDEDIGRLCELKEQLLKQALQLRDRLKNQEENGHQSLINLNIILSSDNRNDKLLESRSAMYEAKLCDISSQVTGIVFKNVSAVEYKELYNFWIHCKSNAITESSNPENSYQSKNDNFEIENYVFANTSEAVVNVTTISQMELEIAMGAFDVINVSNCTVVDDHSGFAGVTQNLSSDELDNSVIVIDKVRMDGKDFNTDIIASESITVNKIAIDKPEENHNEIRSFVIDRFCSE